MNCLSPVLTALPSSSIGSVCKVRTQDPENFDEEVKSLVTAWLMTSSSSHRSIHLLLVFLSSKWNGELIGKNPEPVTVEPNGHSFSFGYIMKRLYGSNFLS